MDTAEGRGRNDPVTMYLGLFPAVTTCGILSVAHPPMPPAPPPRHVSWVLNKIRRPGDGEWLVRLAALRHRPKEALAVLLLSAVVTALATLGPLYGRAVEQSVLRNVLADAPAADRGILVLSTGAEPAAPSRLVRATSAVMRAPFAPPVGGADAPVLVETGSRTHVTRLVARDALCRHVDLTAGRCVRRAGEVLVSSRAAEATDAVLGGTIRAATIARANQKPREAAPSSSLRVVGFYRLPDRRTAYWGSRGHVAPQSARSEGAPLGTTPIDDLLTPWSTLAQGKWPQLRTHLDVPVAVSRVSLDDEPAIARATRVVDREVRTLGASATSRLADVLAGTRTQRAQARTIVPLLTIQLGVLAVVVLAFVCAAVTEQRRPEIALARLRGHGSRGAAGLLAGELGLLVVLGSVLGVPLGWLAALASTSAWLEPGVELEVRGPVLVAVAAAVIAGLLAVVVAAAPTLRAPLTTLLRRVPPRQSALRVGLLEVTVGTAALLAVITLFRGDQGPVAVLAPGLLAVAGGMLLAQALVPAAGPAARHLLRHGRVTPALTAVQLARSPVLRRLVVIITVACSLLVFAVNAWSVSGRNRAVRAGVEAGAPVVLTVNAASSLDLRRVMLDIDPRGRFATPVAIARSATEAGPKTAAVDPDVFARVALWGNSADRPGARPLARTEPDLARPIRLRGTHVEVTAGAVAEGIPPAESQPAPVPGALSLVLGIVHDDGVLEQVELGRLSARPRAYRAAVSCSEGCLLRQVRVTRTDGDFSDAEVTLDVSGLREIRADGSVQAVDLDNTAKGAWQPLPWRAETSLTGSVQPGATLVFKDTSFGTPVAMQRGDVPVSPAALVAGDVPDVAGTEGRKTAQVLAPDLAGLDKAYAIVGRAAHIPRVGTGAVLVDLAAVAEGPSRLAADTSYEVWLAAADDPRERRLREQLERHGLTVIARDTTSRHMGAFADEGATLALRLAVVGGIVALLIAAAVLVVAVALSGRNRARDLASLRLVGLSAGVVRAAAVREHLVVSSLGLLTGTVLGMGGAQAALPHVPLFATRSEAVSLDYAPAWQPVGLTVMTCLVLLSTISFAVGRVLARGATPRRWREAP